MQLPSPQPETSTSTGMPRSSLRHALACQVPDQSIASLYPTTDNYTQDGNLRTPKTLAELCVDAVCRSLPDMDGSLPPNLPPDIVDDIVASLHRHSAWNESTIQALRNCDLESLTLSRCRGVNDAWLAPFGTSPSPTSCIEEGPQNSDVFYGALDQYDGSSCSTGSFLSATSDHAMDEDLDPLFFMDDDDEEQASTEPRLNNLTLLDLCNSQHITDQGLLQLNHLENLKVAKLDHCHALTGPGLAVLTQSVHLQSLSLANCRRLTDEAVLHVSHLVSLRDLCLDGCRCLTDRSLAALTDLVRLRKLDMSQCDLVTDEGLQYLESLVGLEELCLGWCRQITDRGVELLTYHPGRTASLKILRLARCAVGNVEYLGRLLELRELDLNGCANVKNRVLANMLEQLPRLEVLDVSFIPGILRSSWQGKVRSLKSLELCYSNVKDVQMIQFLNQGALEELNFDSCPIGDTTITHLADNNVVPNLQRLYLADTNVTDRGVTKMTKFTQLTHLSLFYCNISNRSLRYVARLPNLRVLNLDSRDISDDGLNHLQHLCNLESLDIFGGRITDAGCVHISKIKSLKSLELCGGGVGDFGCSLLASLDGLTRLNLSQNERISDRGAAALAALSQLRLLNLSHTRVTSRALKFFSSLLHLQSLSVYECSGVSSETLGKLQDGLPNLRCLRVGTSWDDEDGMYIEDTTAEEEEDEDLWRPLDHMDEDRH